VRVLVTGGSGYLGSAAVPALVARGHEVVTIGRHRGVDAVACDLTDPQAVHQAVRGVDAVDGVVHLAARAHDFSGLTLEDFLQANTTTTGNLIAALRESGHNARARFVHASSVAVYEILTGSRQMDARQAPYAASKLEAEHLLFAEPLLSAEPFQSLCVLRFAPIYDPTNLQDVAKRVFLPGTRLKLRLLPPPVHSLCALSTAVDAIVTALEESHTTQPRILNVTDPMPISQGELVSWFPGPALPVPTAVLRAVATGLTLCGRPGRKLSRLIRKFAASSTYPEPGSPSRVAAVATESLDERQDFLGLGSPGDALDGTAGTGPHG
jgi:nucleoside-diphosphate-sugar epimerase